MTDYSSFAKLAVEFFKNAFSRTYPSMVPVNVDDKDDYFKRYDIGIIW